MAPFFGSAIVCVKLLEYSNWTLEDAAFQNSVGKEVTAVRSGDTATVSVTFSYIFSALKAAEPVTVSVVFSSQQAPFPFAEIEKTIPLPVDGAKTVVSLRATL
jgi:hypothetical protein